MGGAQLMLASSSSALSSPSTLSAGAPTPPYSHSLHPHPHPHHHHKSTQSLPKPSQSLSSPLRIPPPRTTLFLLPMSSAAAAVPAPAAKPARKFPPLCWSRDEALVLIEAYRDRWYALHRGYLRTADWDAVAEELGRRCPDASPPKTSAQCRHKMEKLRQRHRAEKQRSQSFPGRFFSSWFYYEAMEAMENSGSKTEAAGDEVNDSGGKNGDPGLKLNPGRGIRFKPVGGGGDRNSVTVAVRSKNGGVQSSSHHTSYAEDESDQEDHNDEFEDDYLVQTPIDGYRSKSLIKNHKNPAPRFQDFQDSQRPRKVSRLNHHPPHPHTHPLYMNSNNEFREEEDGGIWVKMPQPPPKKKFQTYSSGNYRNPKLFDHPPGGGGGGGGGKKRGMKDDGDGIEEMLNSIKMLGDGFMKMERTKMEMAKEIEKLRMEAEMKRNELILGSQRQIIEAFVKGLVESNGNSTSGNNMEMEGKATMGNNDS